VGWLSSPCWLWYATGGFAYAQIKLGSAWVCPTCLSPTAAQPGTALQTSATATGWTVGAGVEWRFAEDWSVKGEYLYVDLGTETNTITYTYPPFTSSLTSSVRENEHIVRFGVNYRFW
jgi:outer membrane immunogenic protein